MNFKSLIYRALNGVFFETDLVVLKVDGGISSQIIFYALGYELVVRGYNVKYDLSWFQTDGLDKSGSHVRNFDFLKAFPNFEFSEASNQEIIFCKSLQNHKSGDPLNLQPPVYINGYFQSRWDCFKKHRKIFEQNFKPPKKFFIKNDLDILEDFQKSKLSCGVHVRRGDLSNYNRHYGSPLETGYFLQAMHHIHEMNPSAKFYFFSDEPDWVKENILKLLGTKLDFRIVEGNGPDRGFIDLFLLSQCDTIVSSQGSFGIMARMLSQDPEKLIFMPSSKPKIYCDDDNIYYI